MATNTFVGTAEWSAWLEEIRRTGKLYVKAFAPPEVVLVERASLQGLIVLHDPVDATEEVGHTARAGQILFWFGDHPPKESNVSTDGWNGYDVKKNLYMVSPAHAVMISQKEMDAAPSAALQRLEEAALVRR